MTAQRNSNWIALVRSLLREGYGVEDIALKLKCPVADVRSEVAIYRTEGKIRQIVRGK